MDLQSSLAGWTGQLFSNSRFPKHTKKLKRKDTNSPEFLSAPSAGSTQASLEEGYPGFGSTGSGASKPSCPLRVPQLQLAASLAFRSNLSHSCFDFSPMGAWLLQNSACSGQEGRWGQGPFQDTWSAKSPRRNGVGSDA